ncbi:3506_t:CDS:1 [Ambispora leptoticha]|uniref:3506_t:CDS:1 n=1 Tax=Ambispora leptoticha TaxID=144679 RepID=A0A9N9FZ69_9GLOM|nr:3506_t:CDS:1 [Ambispora leptoticha]
MDTEIDDENIIINIFPNYEKAVKELLTDLETETFFIDMHLVIRKFLQTTNSHKSEMIEYLSTCQHPQNQVILGALYLEGGEKEKSLQIFKKAAELNDPFAQHMLGDYYSSKSYNPDAAFYWRQRAASQRFPPSYFTLARHYRYGKGVKMNKVNSFQLSLKAIDGGYLGASMDLALAHLYGVGTIRDMHKAIYYLLRMSNINNFTYGIIENIFTQTDLDIIFLLQY